MLKNIKNSVDNEEYDYSYDNEEESGFGSVINPSQPSWPIIRPINF
jgi:hypothetical protein